MASDKALLALADELDYPGTAYRHIAEKIRALVKAHPEEPQGESNFVAVPQGTTDAATKRWRCTRCLIRGKGDLREGNRHNLWLGTEWCGPVVVEPAEGEK
jgi:hypothetical protein